MDATEHFSMAQLDEADAADGLKLSSEARWNQNEASDVPIAYPHLTRQSLQHRQGKRGGLAGPRLRARPHILGA